MIIGKFLDPRAPSLPQQVGINTDDIAEIFQENEEQSANIQQNTDDIEFLKQQVSESGTRVRVNGELVAEWSPDELTDDLQQVRLAQSSDSLAIVGLQSDNITNKNNISVLQGDVTSLNQSMQRTLKVPLSYPPEIELVGVDDNGSQIMVQIDSILSTTSENPVQNKVIANELNWELIWENPNPNTQWAAQTLILPKTFKKYFLVCKHMTTIDIYIGQIMFNGLNTNFVSMNPIGVDGNIVARIFNISDSSFISGSGAYSDTSHTTQASNIVCIPYKIYGIKGDIV